MASLVLAHTQLTERCALVLGRLVEFVPKLAHLDVSWNQLGPVAAEALAGGLIPGMHSAEMLRSALAINRDDQLVLISFAKHDLFTLSPKLTKAGQDMVCACGNQRLDYLTSKLACKTASEASLRFRVL